MPYSSFSHHHSFAVAACPFSYVVLSFWLYPLRQVTTVLRTRKAVLIEEIQHALSKPADDIRKPADSASSADSGQTKTWQGILHARH